MLFGYIDIPGQPDLHNIRRLDLLPSEMIRGMERYGMAIDPDHFRKLTRRLDRELQELRGEIVQYIPLAKLDEFMKLAKDTDSSPINVDSPMQVEQLLFRVLGLGRDKRLKRTKSGDSISTGKKQLETLKRDHPVIPLILSYKERSKLRSTYSVPLPKLAKMHDRGQCWCGLYHLEAHPRVHTHFLMTRTATGRYASKRPNLQNIPARTDLGREIRRGFVAAPGMELVGCDWSQFEMRIGAHLSQDENLIRIFREGLDPHTDTAKRAFNTEHPDKLTQRDPCKNVNFGVFYGLAAEGLYDLMLLTYATAGMDVPDWLTKDWCQDFIDQWFGLYPGVQGLLETQYDRARAYGMVWTMFGRIRRVPEVQSVHRRVFGAGLRQAGNFPVQGTQADLLKIGLARVGANVVNVAREQGIQCYPINTVHDEIILEVDEGYGELVRDLMEFEMSEVLRDVETGDWCFRVPVVADGKVMQRWEK